MMEPGKAARSALLPLFLLLLVLMIGCATIPYDYPRTVSSALYRPETTSIGKKIQAQEIKHRGDSGFYLLPTGVDAFAARALLIDRAEKTLDLQYYIFGSDLIAKFLLDRLVAAAERGVRVRLLLDDWYQTEQMDWWLAVMELYPNIQVRVFNPFGHHRSHPLARPLKMAFGPKRLRGRMHNKAFIADNSVAIVGGRNIAAEYFGQSQEVNFYDMDVLAVGPIARKVSAIFDDYWNCVLAVPIKALMSRQPTADDLQSARRELETYEEALKKSTYGLKVQTSHLLKQIEAGKARLVWAQAEALSDDPLKCINSDDPSRSEKMARRLKAVIEEARSEVLMVSPYFVPGKDGVRWLKKMRDRGVTLKVITNSFVSNDMPVAQIGYMRYRRDLLQMGVELYELKPTLMQLQLDQERSQLGSSLLQFGSSLFQFGSSLLQFGGSSGGALHAKAFVLDRKVVFVGSFNFDPRSRKLDTQDGIVIRSPELAQQAAWLFTQGSSPTRAYRVTLLGGYDLVWVAKVNGQEVHYYQEPLSRFWRRFFVGCEGWLAPESML
jgi:putative cardiolipin synthase